jgi:Transposase DDE domain
MFKIVRFPSAIENFFCSLKTEFLFGHFEYFRILVLLIVISWEDRNISSLYNYLDEKYFTNRTRYNNFMNVARWTPERTLAKKAYELLNSIKLRAGETIYLILDDSKKNKRGKRMDAVGWVHDPISGKSMWGHQFVKATIYAKGFTIPFAIRLYVKDKDCQKLGREFCKLTGIASEIIRSFAVPKGIKVLVLFDTYYLCPAVTKACKEKSFHFVSVLKSNRNLKSRGKKLKAGSYGASSFKNRERMKMKIPKENGTASYTYVDSGWIEVSKLGIVHLIYSRKNSERKILGLVTDHPRLKAVDIIKSYDIRWNIEVFFKDAKQLLGLGRYQNRSYKAVVTHLHLVCFAYALLTHIAIKGTCEKVNKRKKAHTSVKDLQNSLRRIVWNDTAQYLKELPNENSVFKELSRLFIAA